MVNTKIKRNSPHPCLSFPFCARVVARSEDLQSSKLWLTYWEGRTQSLSTLSVLRTGRQGDGMCPGLLVPSQPRTWKTLSTQPAPRPRTRPGASDNHISTSADTSWGSSLRLHRVKWEPQRSGEAQTQGRKRGRRGPCDSPTPAGPLPLTALQGARLLVLGGLLLKQNRGEGGPGPHTPRRQPSPAQPWPLCLGHRPHRAAGLQGSSCWS